MPNGGQHFTEVAHCPWCTGMRIHKRHGFHILARWRCRKCHRTFGSPNWVRKIFPLGTQPPRWAITKEW